MCAYYNLERSVDGWFEPARTLNGRRVGPGALGASGMVGCDVRVVGKGTLN